MEVQFYFRLKNKNIVDKNTMDYTVLVIFFKGLEKANLSQMQDAAVKDHKFLSLYVL